MFNKPQNSTGFSLVEVIFVSALALLVFGAIFGSFQYSLKLISNTRAKLTAVSVANDRMEYFRSLPYDNVGVISGYPAGTIPQNSTSTLNGIVFKENVKVDYMDDPADGMAAADTNSITTDYKRIRLEYTWHFGDIGGNIVLLSYIVPRSIETNAGGGTARINVLDADSTLLTGATVRLIGASSTFPYDVTNLTDLSGAATFSVPADGGYQAIVTANIGGKLYSTSQTYEATTTNPNPTVGPFAVLAADISTLTFQIGKLSDMGISIYSAVEENYFGEDFTNLTSLASYTDVDSDGNKLILKNNAGVYESTGTAYLGPIDPSPLLKWQTIKVDAQLPLDTNYRIHLYTSVTPGIYELVPDSELAGNTLGYTDNLINISKLDVGLYPKVYVGITLLTANTAGTPVIDEISLYYRKTQTPISALSFNLHGTKLIGTNSSFQPIYKYLNNHTTDAFGRVNLTDMEYDDYKVAFTGYDVAMGCPAYPIVQEAGVNGETEIVLVPNSASTLRVSVVDGLGRAVPNATVKLERPGYDVTKYTNYCGQTFFAGGGLSDNSDYVLTVSSIGHSTVTRNSFSVIGDSVDIETLSP